MISIRNPLHCIMRDLFPSWKPVVGQALVDRSTVNASPATDHRIIVSAVREAGNRACSSHHLVATSRRDSQSPTENLKWDKEAVFRETRKGRMEPAAQGECPSGR
jgi:hypothetical protein